MSETVENQVRTACDNKLVVRIASPWLLNNVPRFSARVYHCGRIACIVGPQGVKIKDDGRGEYWPSPCRTLQYASVKSVAVVDAKSKILSRLAWRLYDEYLELARKYRRLQRRLGMWDDA